MKAQRLDLHPGVQGRSYSHDMWPRRSLHEPPGSLSVLFIHPGLQAFEWADLTVSG
jgi:hypothetical protein